MADFDVNYFAARVGNRVHFPRLEPAQAADAFVEELTITVAIARN
ncbi:MAG TPA: hypothetical protein VF755_05720 [Catenuloplanes sp.]